MQTQTSPPPVNAEDLADLFHRVTRLMARTFHRRDHSGHAQAHVLELLARRGPMGQGEMLEILDVRASSLSEVLAKLERAGRVRRRRNEQDRRSFIIEAMPGAGAADASADDARREASEALFAGLDEAERAELRALLLKLAAPLEADPLCRADGDHVPGGHCHGRGRGFGHGGPGGSGPGRRGGGRRGQE